MSDFIGTHESIKQSKWIDTRINLTFVLAFVVQAVTAFIWIGNAAQRLDDFENRLNAQPPLNERMARIEAEMQGARQSLNRIENRLDNSKTTDVK